MADLDQAGGLGLNKFRLIFYHDKLNDFSKRKSFDIIEMNKREETVIIIIHNNFFVLL